MKVSMTPYLSAIENNPNSPNPTTRSCSPSHLSFSSVSLSPVLARRIQKGPHNFRTAHKTIVITCKLKETLLNVLSARLRLRQRVTPFIPIEWWGALHDKKALYNYLIQLCTPLFVCAMPHVKPLFQICGDYIYLYCLYCIQDLKYLNLPPLIFNYFLEREYYWCLGQLPDNLPLFCTCLIKDYPYFEQYKEAVLNLTSESCCKYLLRQLPPLRSTSMSVKEH